MGDSAPDQVKKAAAAGADEVTALARSLWNEAQKHPKAAAAAAIGIGAVAAAVLFATRKGKPEPKVPKNFKPESD